jgi:hypothetical protein
LPQEYAPITAISIMTIHGIRTVRDFTLSLLSVFSSGLTD